MNTNKAAAKIEISGANLAKIISFVAAQKRPEAYPWVWANEIMAILESLASDLAAAPDVQPSGVAAYCDWRDKEEPGQSKPVVQPAAVVEPVAQWQWRAKGAALWANIDHGWYEQIKPHRTDLEFRPLYTAPPTNPDAAERKVPDEYNRERVDYYLCSVKRHLEALREIANAQGFGPTVGSEALADNIDWLDCYMAWLKAAPRAQPTTAPADQPKGEG